MTGRQDKGSDFRCEKTIKLGEDPEEAETRWYRWNKEEKRWEFYGNERPSWDELSEGAKDTFVRAYDIIFRSCYKKERTEAIEGGMDPQDLPESPETMLEILYYLDKVQINDGLIPRNATDAVKPPQVRREEIQPLTPEQVKMLLDTARGERLEALYALAVHTGLRQGELLGLKWEDVDLESGSLHVKRTLTTARGGPRLAAPKTKGSRRVSLTRGAVDALRAHLARQLEEIDRAGSLWQENGLVFASETGEPLDRRDLTTRQFKPLLKRAKLPEKTRFHDLRHTCATLLLTKNVNPKVVSEMLGHSNIAITLDTYSHVLPNMQDSAARALEEALS